MTDTEAAFNTLAENQGLTFKVRLYQYNGRWCVQYKSSRQWFWHWIRVYGTAQRKVVRYSTRQNALDAWSEKRDELREERRQKLSEGIAEEFED